MKNLFLTGPIGCGKSTSIATALGEHLEKAGGFLTVRQKNEEGRAVAYRMTRPDGSDGQIILNYSAKPYTMHLEVFEDLGLRIVQEAQQYDYVILDEIGGFEVLSDAFLEALMQLLRSDIPCIGVMKGEGPASNMIRKLGLGDTYVQRAENLRQWMRQDENTLLYECTQFDPEGLRLAKEWVNAHTNL
jgi:nucleoside-triphosphatase THEP1